MILVHRRHVVRSLVVACLLSLVVAAGTPAAEPRRLTIAIPLIAESLDARTFSALAYVTLNQIHGTLFSVDPQGKYRPALAESWRLVDAHTWQFRLRKNARFHTGEEVTAADVKFSVEFVLDPANKHPNRSRFTDIKEVQVVDRYTVNLVTKDPSGALLSNIFRLYVLPSAYLKSKGLEEFARVPVGAGPFRVKSHTPGDRVVLVAHRDFWGGPPQLDEVTLRAIPEHATRMAAVETGEADIAWFVPPEHVDRLKAKGFGITLVGTNQVRALVLGTQATRTKPLEDRRVRQALNLAVDKEGLNKFLFNGLWRVADGQVIGPAAFGYSPVVKAYPYDPERAKRLLAEAGYAGGFTVGFEFPVGRYIKDKEYAEAVAGQLAAVGVRLQLKPLESGVWFQKYIAGTIGPVFMVDLGPSVDLDFGTARFPSWSQSKFWANEAFDALFRKQRATVDQTERQKVLADMAALFREEAPCIFGLEVVAIHAVAPRVSGAVFPADGTIDVATAAAK
jgi:peptide/nickel transport system substrate-binding protein